MSSPSYTYSLVNGTVVDASQLTQNFSDILNGVTDGTKDLSISALTCAGTTTLNGSINLGNAVGDDLTITASLASTIGIKTNNTYGIGGATLGLSGIYLGNGGAGLTCRIVSASHATTRTYTVPDCSSPTDFFMCTSAQTATGLKTFYDGLAVQSGGSTLSYYKIGSVSTTFTAGGGTGSPSPGGAVTVRYRRIGDWVTCHLPAIAATTANGSTYIGQDTAVDSWARPLTSSQNFLSIEIIDNNAALTTTGYAVMTVDGKILLYKNVIGTQYTNNAPAGVNRGMTFTYYVGTGS